MFAGKVTWVRGFLLRDGMRVTGGFEADRRAHGHVWKGGKYGQATGFVSKNKNFIKRREHMQQELFKPVHSLLFK